VRCESILSLDDWKPNLNTGTCPTVAAADSGKPREEVPVSAVPDSACELAAWGLPDTILAQYAEKGIHTMFPWQVCLLVLPSRYGTVFWFQIYI
jgi:hypothetical protein